MPAQWLYSVGAKGVLVTPDFMERLRNGDKAALRALNRQGLATLYRKGFTRASRRPDAEGLFWSSTPPLELIPHVRGRRHWLPAWIKDEMIAEVIKDRKNTWYPPKATERAERGVWATAAFERKRMKRGEQNVVVRREEGRLIAWRMKANPKFDLVVVNRHDRAALLRLLGELEKSLSVNAWLDARTVPFSENFSTVLHTDYTEWCRKHGHDAIGPKGFAQALVAAGVKKLPRHADGVRYELMLV